jgi:hypothetical protein
MEDEADGREQGSAELQNSARTCHHPIPEISALLFAVRDGSMG